MNSFPFILHPSSFIPFDEPCFEETRDMSRMKHYAEQVSIDDDDEFERCSECESPNPIPCDLCGKCGMCCKCIVDEEKPCFEETRDMSRMKHYAEQVSIDMGLGGELTDEVLAEADRRLHRLEPEPVYTIFQVFASLPLCETVSVAGLVQTMPQLAPDLYEIREAGVVIATGERRDDGDWRIEFMSGVILGPGCMIV
jgi:hypothetical protein